MWNNEAAIVVEQERQRNKFRPTHFDDGDEIPEWYLLFLSTLITDYLNKMSNQPLQ